MLSSVCNLECLRWFPLSSHPWCSSWGMGCCSLGLLGLCSINQSASQICGTKNPNIFSFLSFSIKCMGEYWKHYLKPLIQTLSYRAAKLRPSRKNGHTNNLFFSKYYFKSSQFVLVFEQFPLTFRRQLFLAMSIFLYV